MGILLKFAVPMFVNGMFRRFCGVMSTIIMKGFMKAGTLTTINSAKAVVFLVVNFLLKLATNFAMLATRGCNTKGVSRVHRAIKGTLVLATLVSTIVATVDVANVRTLLGFVRAPSSVFGSTCTCIVVVYKKVFTRTLCGVLTDVLHTLKGDGMPLCFLVLSTVLGVILSLMFVVIFGLKTPKTT